jgi:hypothetical protein
MTELYTMDQMRDYAEAYHRSRVESSRADGGKDSSDGRAKLAEQYVIAYAMALFAKDGAKAREITSLMVNFAFDAAIAGEKK